MASCIHSANDLVTSHEQTRAGFIEAAMEKNIKAKPYIEQAKTLRSIASTVLTPDQLINKHEIYPALVTAAGLSDKACNYFTEEDKKLAINELIEKFLVPAGGEFVNELVYRFLLIKGDSLGGSMRNYVGTIAQMKFVRKILSIFSIEKINHKILLRRNVQWQSITYETAFEIADDIKAITWQTERGSKVIFFNTKIPLVGNNVDICLYKGDENTYEDGNIVLHDELAIMFGELKGGIDPAGADEHWKTGNTALERIRTAFYGYDIKTSFIAASIEAKMATEIYEQLQNSVLAKAANITVDQQLTEYCQWLISL